MLRLFPSMGSRDFRRLFWAAGLSAISLWALITARGWLAGELTNSGWAVGVVYFAAIGPWVLAPIGGALADRYDRARVLMISRAGVAICALVLAALAFTGTISFWNLVLVTACSGVLRSAEMPAQAALLPNTVKAAALLSAITLASMMQFGSRVIGPVAGPVLAEYGAKWVFLISAGFLVLSIIQMTRIKTRSTGGAVTTDAGLLADAAMHVREGMRYLGQNRGVMMLIGLAALQCMLTMAFDALLVVFAKVELGGGSSEYGFLLMGVGGGALVAMFALSMVPEGPIRGRLLLITGLLSGAVLPVLGLAPSLYVAMIGAALAGASQAMFMALTTVMIQAVVPDAIRGRVIAIYAMVAGGIMAVMILANGLASDIINVRYLITIPGIIFVVALLLWAGVMPRLRAVFRQGDIGEAAGDFAAAVQAAAASAAVAMDALLAAPTAPQQPPAEHVSGD